MNQTNASTARDARSLLPTGARKAFLRRWRLIKDRMARWLVAAGGSGVIIALALIFVYLFYEVAPLFRSASLQATAEYGVEGVHPDSTLHLAMERYNEYAVAYDRDAAVVFFRTDGSGNVERKDLALPEGVHVTSFASGTPRSGLAAYGLSNGSVAVLRHDYLITYPDDRRYLEPLLDYPLGEEMVEVDPRQRPLTAIAIQQVGDGVMLAGQASDRELLLNIYRSSTNFMTGETVLSADTYPLGRLPAQARFMLINATGRNLLIGDDRGVLHNFDISVPGNASLVQSKRVVPEGTAISAMNFLNGTQSLVIGGSDGSVVQWYLVRDEENVYHITRVRTFEKHASAIVDVIPETGRRGFITTAADGTLGVHYGTSHSTVLTQKVFDGPVAAATVSPVNSAMLLLDNDGRLHRYDYDNAHPEVSWSSLWGKVWYEGRSQPEYVWQASSGSDEFEPKFSLVPLSVGTLKAAFFAMLFAMPLAIMGAIYTAYFMTPKLRGKVKPTIEVMEALPTVILGFLAGLWLAPFLENNLPAVFSLLLLMPAAMLAFAALWSLLPQSLRQLAPPGWEAALLVPVVLLIGWFCVWISPLIEVWFFDGSTRQWLTEVGITYDQRNALVVGLAMGFAVIPTIFSIAEDAVFNVPKHLTQGSLALGATPWQTVVGVVLPTASPGIFSAIMIGFGRAVGETMIVLMATGNSPVVNFNIFEGMRTLSANVAVELPETAVGSSHFRVLFLASLVLLTMTFLVNTVAELVRQRLRERYSAL